MKARVKATGEIVEVIAISDYINDFGQIIGEYEDANRMLYNSYDLEFYVEDGNTIPYYWTRLEHQYAGMAMQGLLNNNLLSLVLFKTGTTHEDYINEAVKVAKEYAHALVEKMKEVK